MHHHAMLLRGFNLIKNSIISLLVREFRIIFVHTGLEPVRLEKKAFGSAGARDS